MVFSALFRCFILLHYLFFSSHWSHTSEWPCHHSSLGPSWFKSDTFEMKQLLRGLLTTINLMMLNLLLTSFGIDLALNQVVNLSCYSTKIKKIIKNWNLYVLRRNVQQFLFLESAKLSNPLKHPTRPLTRLPFVKILNLDDWQPCSKVPVIFSQNFEC